MESKKKVLMVTQELDPYTALTEAGKIVYDLSRFLQDENMEVRILMPRFGTINERRHRLHEVVRLSGMNIIVDDDDYPLIIKVASLPGARMQVYFLDNEDFFKNRGLFATEKGEWFDDNAERMIFFCKGVVETVKKFGWPPDIIHAHGWMTSLLPLYIRTAYKAEPLFRNAHLIYSAYGNTPEASFSDKFLTKASINQMEESDLDQYFESGALDFERGALNYSDAVIVGHEEALSAPFREILKTTDKPVLKHPGEETFLREYLDFYNALLEEEVESR
ncbi:MAG TPA: starch synthase [Phaeodactylibacter sp.]|nr:starch synthase [Phaeodactylibacter sp.]